MTSLPEYFEVIFPDQKHRVRSTLRNQRKLYGSTRTKLTPEEILKTEQKSKGEIKTEETEWRNWIAH